MISTKVARRYGRAIFSAASQLKVITEIENNLVLVVNLLHAQPEFRHFLYHPAISYAKKLTLLEKVFQNQVHPLILQFLKLLLVKSRETEFKAICQEFIELRRRRENTAFAEVLSAYPLDETDRKKLIQKLESKVGKKIEAVFHVHERLIGGIKVTCENYIWNGTLEDAIHRLRESTLYYGLKQI
jgi:F-type H+-transporting ATPase subunit delta